ncbi:hypothetical protein ABPG75_006935 [Micractinium tetrahymenae]
MAQTRSFEGQQYIPLAAAKLVFEGATAVTRTALGHVERLALRVSDLHAEQQRLEQKQQEYEAAVALLYECTAALEAEFSATDSDLEEAPTPPGGAAGPQGKEHSRTCELDVHVARKEKAAWRARALHAESRFAQLRAVLQARTLQAAATAALDLREQLSPAVVALEEEAAEQAPASRQQRAVKKGSGRPRGRPRKVRQGQEAAVAVPAALPPEGNGGPLSAPGS